MRLIDADSVRSAFDTEFKSTMRLIEDGESHLDNLAEGFTEADKVIWMMPTVDAVPVVRCKNCKYRDGTPGQPNIQCGNMPDGGFCSYGERKDEANES